MDNSLAIIVFVVTLLATVTAAYLGRTHEARRSGLALANQGLSKWLVGLSAGATANSGFVVTAAVGLGYTEGARWLLLPAAWLVGDVIFWHLFPHRINSAARTHEAATATDILVASLSPGARRNIKRLVGVISVLCLGGYVSAQWLSGEKFLAGAFALHGSTALLLFATTIVVYSSLGGFRGSVYADTVQAVVRIMGTALALVTVTVTAVRHRPAFAEELQSAGADFLHIVPEGGLLLSLVSSLGFAAAALGFGLGQPQMLTRYMAGSSPSETRSAWWIYFVFVQGTWIAMTAFGIILRGVMPGLEDPEAGLSTFHRMTTGPVITGIIAADIFATIAATSNSILVAIAQTILGDLRQLPEATVRYRSALWRTVAFAGAISMGFSLVMGGSVKDLALSSVGIMGSALAPAMAIRLLGWRFSATSLSASIVAGFLCASCWMMLGFNAYLNEAAPGILAGFLAHFAVIYLRRASPPTR